ncbi:MAG: hypothetical protein H0U66_02550 [Gemmatimonadaceae bacterium]|nr:hypothetical protein [Gemmatimonadaceae bacterium]
MADFLPSYGFRALIAGALLTIAARSNAQGLSEKLLIHGYLTQGYATTSGPMILGIPNDGTFDYRRAALLLRFKAATNDVFVVQIANRRLGESEINHHTSELQLDWAFYEHNFGENTSIRVGKAPIPMGISNETRFLGTLLPFYRVPFGFYQEGGFTSETLDGAVVTHKFNPGSAWLVTGAAFAGEFNYLQTGAIPATENSPGQYLVVDGRARNLFGVQLWLQTPLPGLRVGGGAARRQDEGTISDQISGRGATRDFWGSVDGSFDRLTARAEYRNLTFGEGGAKYRTYYGQVGYRILEALSITVQRDVTDLDVPTQIGRLALKYDRDNAIGVSYMFAPNVVGKLELHDAHGYGDEVVVNYGDPAIHNRYSIASVSVSF